MDELEALLIAQQQRDAEAARAGVNTDVDGWKSWLDRGLAFIRGERSHTPDGTIESVATVRARRQAEWEARQGAS